jgi:hypothetical protein
VSEATWRLQWMIFHPCTAAGRFQPRFSLPWLSFFGFFDLLLLVTSTEVLSALLFAAALRVFWTSLSPSSVKQVG